MSKPRNPNLRQVAKEAAIKLLAVGVLKRKWTPDEQSQWNRAFRALEKLSGTKLS